MVWYSSHPQAIFTEPLLVAFVQRPNNQNPSVVIPSYQLLLGIPNVNCWWNERESGDEANATEGKKNPKLMRSILPCLKNASQADFHYSALKEQCFQQSKVLYRGLREYNSWKKRKSELTGEQAQGNLLQTILGWPQQVYTEIGLCSHSYL